METQHPAPLTDLELNALLDPGLPALERQALETRLARDETGQQRLAAWQNQRDLLRGLHRDLLDEPVPSTLLEAAARLGSSRQRASQWWRWGGMAASLALAFAAGWGLHAQWPPIDGGARSMAQAASPPGFARDAAVAHAVYSPEKRHPVEVDAADEAHLVQWLSRRMGRELKIPRLTAQGYELVGGRLLPGDSGARAQFMFQNAAGVRVTLYLGAVTAPSTSQNTHETAFSYSKEGPVPGFYWVDQGFGYALSGPLDRDALMALALAVYPQL